MRNLIRKSAQLVGVFLLCALFTLSINAIFSGMLSVLSGSSFLGIFRSDGMIILSVLGFVLSLIMFITALTEKK